MVGHVCGLRVSEVTILPSTSGVGGFTAVQDEDGHMPSRKNLQDSVLRLYAGRCAEILAAGSDNATIGAVNDITKATDILTDMVTKYGLADTRKAPIDMTSYKKGHSITAISALADVLYRRTTDILSANRYKLDRLAEALIQRETLSGDEIRSILR